MYEMGLQIRFLIIKPKTQMQKYPQNCDYSNQGVLINRPSDIITFSYHPFCGCSKCNFFASMDGNRCDDCSTYF